jgi:hypothetical protein
MTPDKSQVLDDLCDIFDLTNIVKNPTCFMKGCEPSLVDVILTNKNNLCFKTLNFNTGVSDCHHMISTFICRLPRLYLFCISQISIVAFVFCMWLFSALCSCTVLSFSRVSILYGCMMINDLRDFSFKIIIIVSWTRIMSVHLQNH